MAGTYRKPWSKKRRESLADDLDLVIGDLCVQWGFCNQLDAAELVREHSTLTGDIFAAAVLAAEGMSPEP
jgi:hypothetical protein